MFFALFEIISFIITIMLKLIYYLLIGTYNLLKFLLTTKSLRFPFVLLLLSYFLQLPFYYITTIYFIYLINKYAIKFHIYKTIFNNIKTYFKNIFTNFKVSQKLKQLNSDFIILNNISVENDDSLFCKIDHLLITYGGVFNIIQLKDIKELSIDKYGRWIKDESSNPQLENNLSKLAMHNGKILRDILPDDIPISNIIVIPTKDTKIIGDFNSETPIIPINCLDDYIDNSLCPDICEPIYIKEVIYEYKLWLLDNVFLEIKNFIYSNKNIILFILLSIIFYYLYINSILFISENINSLFK